jgi:RimJ/RimL family protein N-acetyltransferase
VSWPLHDLVLRTPDLELRGTTEADAHRLAAVIPADVPHDPELPDLPGDHRVLLKYGQAVGRWRPEDWNLWFTVRLDGEVVGAQGLEGKDFRAMRTVETWSWLVPSARARGLGKQMRAAVLELAFVHLGAARSLTEAWEDNASSLGVSRAMGYVDNGVDLRVRRPLDGVEVETAGRMQRMILETWTSPLPVTVEGLDACLALLGV